MRVTARSAAFSHLSITHPTSCARKKATRLTTVFYLNVNEILKEILVPTRATWERDFSVSLPGIRNNKVGVIIKKEY